MIMNNYMLRYLGGLQVLKTLINIHKTKNDDLSSKWCVTVYTNQADH